MSCNDDNHNAFTLAVAETLRAALLDIRQLLYARSSPTPEAAEKAARQAALVADIFHNLPLYLTTSSAAPIYDLTVEVSQALQYGEAFDSFVHAHNLMRVQHLLRVRDASHGEAIG